ncbi:hypothetical protein HY003_03125 [Candidatus Saccharibacteria bacterium]|nr:hypothetical protein [Candidatus Saccharibacteria bacterium]MBI3338267.1 hypothetical protein [Candidatus Saccharibacteria bacterium]
MTSEISQPKPQQELITGIPTPEDHERMANEQSIEEDTLSLGALERVIAGEAEGMHAADLNKRHPIKPSSMESRPTVPLPEAAYETREPYVPGPGEETVYGKEAADLRAQARAIYEAGQATQE